MLACLDAVQSYEFVLRLRGQLGLNVLNKSVKLLDSVLLGFLNFLDRALYLTDVVFEIPQTSTQPTGFSADQVHMLLVDLLELFKLVALVRVSK